MERCLSVSVSLSAEIVREARARGLAPRYLLAMFVRRGLDGLLKAERKGEDGKDDRENDDARR